MTGNALHHAKDATQEKLGEYQFKMNEAKDDAKVKMDEMKERAKDSMGEMTENAAEEMSNMNDPHYKTFDDYSADKYEPELTGH
ncbi:hypothetical protein PVAND_017266 [Polypedilum vanderplanki]|uniref:Uncharacterized protein n=1 Tax=Polypedilum vanderplanki TaxID=319348 RepID=A0A9J6BIK2_POLVA|nr:hypothetical protein PVAND_017266 [Polypedilum vanderplanki]